MRIDKEWSDLFSDIEYPYVCSHDLEDHERDGIFDIMNYMHLNNIPHKTLKNSLFRGVVRCIGTEIDILNGENIELNIKQYYDFKGELNNKKLSTYSYIYNPLDRDIFDKFGNW